MSSGSEIDDRKRKRKESNRESARRSRMKKQRHVEELVKEMAFLEKEISGKRGRLEGIWKASEVVEAENRVLREEEARLEQRLRSLEYWMLMNLGDDEGYLADTIFHLNNSHHLKAWQLHRLQQHHPITVSGAFNY